MSEQFKRWLILIGESTYAHLGAELQLPGAKSEVLTVQDVLCTYFGFELCLPWLRDSPTADRVRSDIGQWLTDDAREPSDIVVVYFTGHGQIGADGQHYLLTTESRADNLVGTALAADTLGSLLTQSPVQHCLFVLDTCFAEEGSLDITNLISRVKWTRTLDSGLGSGVYAIAAARPFEKAKVSAFANAFSDALLLDSMGGTNQAFLDIAALVSAVNVSLERSHQSARYSVASGSGTSPIFPNQRFQPLLPEGLDIATQRRLVDQGDLDQYWSPRARGVAVGADSGQYFVGRRAILDKIMDWLEGFDTERNGVVVTGDPGSGKSAVLARLFLLSDEELALRYLDAGIASRTPPRGSVLAAIYCRRKTLSDVIDELNSCLGRKNLGINDLIELLSGNSYSHHALILDGVDEAEDAHHLVQELVLPLSNGRGVRLLIGCRRYILPSLGQAFEVLDVDDEAFADLEDIADYVAMMLALPSDAGLPSGFADTTDPVFGQLVQGIADHAYPSFLIARLSARSFAGLSRSSFEIPGPWKFPETVDEAMSLDLDRYAEDREKVMDLLRPLAYAKGGGLPWDTVWAEAASAMSETVNYQDCDISWLMENAGGYVVQTIQSGRSVYRLYHQALTDFLRPSDREAGNLASFVDGLLTAVPVSAADEFLWWSAPSYVLDYLPVHAAEGDRFGTLLRDQMFATHARPKNFLRAISVWKKRSEAASKELLEIAQCYEQAFYILEVSEPSDRASYLALAALRTGSTYFCDVAETLNPSSGWVPLAATNRGIHLRTVTELRSEPHACAVVDLGGVPGVVFADHAGAVVCFSTSSFVEVWRVSPWPDRRVISLAASADGTHLLCSNSRGQLRVLDAETGMVLHETASLGASIVATHLHEVTEQSFEALLGDQNGNISRVLHSYGSSEQEYLFKGQDWWISALQEYWVGGTRVVAVTGGEETVRIHREGQEDHQVVELAGHGTCLTGSLLSGQYAVAGDTRGTLTVIDLVSGHYWHQGSSYGEVVSATVVTNDHGANALFAIYSTGAAVTFTLSGGRIETSDLINEPDSDWRVADSYIAHAAAVAWGGELWGVLAARDGVIFQLPFLDADRRAEQDRALAASSAGHFATEQGVQLVIQDISGDLELVDAVSCETLWTGEGSVDEPSPLTVVEGSGLAYALTLGGLQDQPQLFDLDARQYVDQAWLASSPDFFGAAMVSGDVYMVASDDANLIGIDFSASDGEIEGKILHRFASAVTDMDVCQASSPELFLVVGDTLYSASLPIEEKPSPVGWATDIRVLRVAACSSMHCLVLLTTDGRGRVYSTKGQAMGPYWRFADPAVVLVEFVEVAQEVLIAIVGESGRTMTLRYLWGPIIRVWDFGAEIVDVAGLSDSKLAITTVSGIVVAELRELTALGGSGLATRSVADL